MILAIGQENAFPWIEDDLGLEFDKWHVPVVDKVTFQSTRPEVFFGGDSAFGPKNIIWAVEHGHQAAISIHNFAMGQPVTNRLPPTLNLSSRKMGLHEWSYRNDYNPVERRLVPHVSLKERFKQLDIEVELGFDAEQAAAEVQRCLNCDVQTVFEAKLCIECDACIDICPTDCLTITRGGEEAELATRLKAPRAQPQPAAVRLRSAQADRPRHGQGRGPLRALRTLRRALPDGGLGHAEVHYPPAPRDRSQMAKPATAQDRVNDFVVKLANVNGTGSASANTLLMKAIFRMGVPVMGKNYFPSNIQGLPTWYEIRVTKHGYVARSGRVDLMVAMNAETYHKDVREVSPGGFLIYDSTWPRASVLSRDDIVILGVPFAKICNENFVGVRNRILMKNIMYAGALAALLEIDVEVIRQLLTESYSKKPALVDANMKAVQLGYDYAKQHLPCPLPLRIERMNATAGHVMIDGNTAAGLGAVYAGATVGPWYPITPSTSLMDAFKGFCAKLRVDPETGKANYAVIQAEDELSAIGMVLGANWNGARAFTATSGPGISLMSEFIGLAYYAEIPAVIFDIQRVGPSTGMPTRTQQCDILLCAYASHGDTQARAAVPLEPGRMLLHDRAGLRPRRAPADPGVRAVGPRHRHERLDVPGAQVGRQLSPRPRQGAEQGGDRGAAEVPALPRQGRRRHPVPDAAGRDAEGRLLHARLGPQPVRRLHRGLDRVPGRARPAAAQVQACAHADAGPGHRGDRHERHRPGGDRQQPRRRERSARHPGEARHPDRLHAHQGLPVHARKSRRSWPRTRRSSWSSRTATRSCARCSRSRRTCPSRSSTRSCTTAGCP